MELAGADDKDGKPDSGELSGKSESNVATNSYWASQPSPLSVHLRISCFPAFLRDQLAVRIAPRIHEIITPHTNIFERHEKQN